MQVISKENHGRNQNDFRLLTALVVHNYDYYEIVE